VNKKDPTGRDFAIEIALTDSWTVTRDQVAGITLAVALNCAYDLLASETNAWVALGLAGDGDSGTVSRSGPCSVKEKSCKKASPWQLANARPPILDEHAFKEDYVGGSVSLYDICACNDGSITIAGVRQCGKSGPQIPTDATW
jgi:hypothetical protein